MENIAAAVAALSLVLLFVILAAAILKYRPEKGASPNDRQQTQETEAEGVRGGAREERGAARRRRLQAALRANDGERDADELNNQLHPGRHADQPSTSRKTAYEELRRKRDQEREAKEEAAEQEALQKEQEKQAIEDAEAAKWVGQMSTELEGTGEVSEAQDESLVQRFVEYIIDRKSVVLEEAAVVFGLRVQVRLSKLFDRSLPLADAKHLAPVVQDIISRIEALESLGRLTGIMDDRGKYMYVSSSEMKAVASYICKKGRVALQELAAKSNELIDLEEKIAEPAASDSALDPFLESERTENSSNPLQ